MTIALIDGDIVVYSSAFAAEGRHYLVRDHKIKYKKEAKEYCKKEGIPESEIMFYTTPEPVENALHNAKSLINNILGDVRAEQHFIFISGEDNFREEAAVTLPYKGNREAMVKPVHYEAVKDYLVDQWTATVVDGMEADDAMGLMQGEGTVICTIDKDLDQIPGWHYHWREKVLYQIQPIEGMRNFYKQMLTGDRVDNIAGIGGIGDKTADRMLKDVLTTSEMEQIVRDAYERQHGEDWLARFNENAALLWIKRDGEERYIYKGADEREEEVQEQVGARGCPTTRIEMEL